MDILLIWLLWILAGYAAPLVGIYLLLRFDPAPFGRRLEVCPPAQPAPRAVGAPV